MTLGQAKNFLVTTKKQYKDKLHFIKTKTLFFYKSIINKVKRQTVQGEKIFQYLYLTKDVQPAYKTNSYKSLIKRKHILEKKSQDLNINLKRGFQMFGEHVKRHSTSLDIRKMIIKIKITILNMLKY